MVRHGGDGAVRQLREVRALPVVVPCVWHGAVQSRLELGVCPQADEVDERSPVSSKGQDRTLPRIEGAGAHTLSVRVRDNAGNWSAWADHPITVVLGVDTTAPTDTTVIPVPWQLVNFTVTVTATDDVDGTGVDYVQWRYGNQPTGQGPSGSSFTISTDGDSFP